MQVGSVGCVLNETHGAGTVSVGTDTTPFEGPEDTVFPILGFLEETAEKVHSIINEFFFRRRNLNRYSEDLFSECNDVTIRLHNVVNLRQAIATVVTLCHALYGQICIYNRIHGVDQP